MRADAEGEVRVRRAVHVDCARIWEHGRVVVGAQPAHHDEVPAPDLLAPQLRVAGARAAERLVDGGPAQVLLARAFEKVGVLGQAVAELWLAGKVHERQRRERRCRVDAAADEVPHDGDQLVVGHRSPLDLHGDQTRDEVVAGMTTALRDHLLHLGDHLRRAGNGRLALGHLLAVGRRRVEVLGPVLPGRERKAHQLHRPDRRYRIGVVEHHVHLPGRDLLVQAPGGGLLEERAVPVDRRRQHEGIDGTAQGDVAARLGLGDPDWWQALVTGYAHDPDVAQAVGRAFLVARGEGLTVACDLGHLLVARHVPEPVGLVPDHRGLSAELVVVLVALRQPLDGVIIEVGFGSHDPDPRPPGRARQRDRSARAA